MSSTVNRPPLFGHPVTPASPGASTQAPNAVATRPPSGDPAVYRRIVEARTTVRHSVLSMSHQTEGLKSLSEQCIRSLGVRYGYYPENHPLTRYVQGLADRLPNGVAHPRVLVTRTWDTINALALPDGTIVVSDRLIHFCQFE